MELTQEQQVAVGQRGVSVALSAGAGCGKTHVLTERFLSYLDPEASDGKPARLSELVAITFTERAAREMRLRIRRSCRERLLQAHDDTTASYWLGILRELDSARISTIHSFCRQLLQRHAVEAGIDPHFRVLEEAEANTLLLELVDDTLRGRLAEAKEPFLQLLTTYSLQTVRKMVQEFLDNRLQIDFEYWRQRTPQELVELWQQLYPVCFEEYRKDFLRQDEVQELFRLIELLKERGRKLPDRLLILEETLKCLPQSTDVDRDIGLLRENARVQGIPNSFWPTQEIYVNFRDTAKAFREKRLPELQKFSRLPEPSESEELARMALHVFELAYEVRQAYQKEKQQQAALDFDDLVAEVVCLLEGPYGEDVRGQLAAEIRHLLVDEFQDTDPMQVRLIERLCGPDFLKGKLFFVGDYKQSIYRFRGARPEEFHRLRSATPKAGQLSLTKNFRSQPGILDFVNALFCEEMGPDYEPLRPHRRQLNPEPIVEFLWAKEAAEAEWSQTASYPQDEENAEDQVPGQQEAKAATIRGREADWIARRIRQLLDSGQPLVLDQEAAKQGQERLRPPQPGDIAVLFRALSDIQIYEEALRQYEISYYLVGGHAFYAQQEIYDLLNLLRAIQSPLDEVALVGVLRSPFFNLHDETLYWLVRNTGGALGSRQISRLWAGLCAEKLPAELELEQRRRVRFAAATLQWLRAVKDRMPIADLIQEAIHRTGYDAALLAEFLGERKLANLYKLIDQARSMDQTGLFSLADFIFQLHQFVLHAPKEPLAATFPETCEVVRLMTIHQAKGLEFPIVIVADLGRGSRQNRADAAFHPDYGPLIKPPANWQKDNGVTFWDIYWHQEQMADLQEEIRIFYVATTRAADYLILSTGWWEKPLKSPWMTLLESRFNLDTGELKVNLPEGYPAPAIRVVDRRPEFAGQTVASQPRRYLKDLLEKTVQTLLEGRGQIPAHLEPLRPDPAAARRYSFSRLTGQLELLALQEEDQHPVQYGPYLALGFGRQKHQDLGILIHSILAQLDYQAPEKLGDLAARLAFRHLGHLPANEAAQMEKEAVEMVGEFLASARAKQIAAAQKLYREVEFLLAWPPDGSEPKGSYVQGFLDYLYQDQEGRWHVVDFKTHQVKGRNQRQLAAQYELQMLLYGLACQEILSTAPTELVIYFLRTGKEFVFTWTEASRQLVITQMNQAIKQLIEFSII
ncbi:MAG: UvrD-helicase domain-containing protein [Thermoguttaceae bacterium]|nr:UvrD-helicase domain-containing protein [Thermoguttaceae bacterium]MDW8038552.1 UvrD-helicase domain-containing protein [Thermoguttaceae bacterium]